ncbi:class I SAM-dependent methyltransferase [Geosporobacter ferrireducens]|uniref:Methyltransferase type 11 domain-containing protein n=1 Tax=Geosporobacter ferrireducens TaxID=1424294 RepID=A0A1D8GL36_9FIRM|nr:class I SAM-dependent methyltransferase [Geosporobacter ferrireducens]AOT71617.1 hypothetical protein Gferi_20010 [Geosporobacter ferrireducens]
MIEKQIEKYWDERSQGYSTSIQEQMNSPKKEVWKSLIKKYAGEGDKIKAMDVGAGPGFFSILMGELDYGVTTVDVSEDMLKEAKKSMEYAGFQGNFVKGEAHQIDFPDQSVDLIVSRNVVWTLTKPEETYKEWRRLLKPGGKILVFDSNWYLHLSDPELQKQYNYYRRLAIEKGLIDEVTEEQHKRVEEIAKELPLTYRKRPEWDQEVLTQLGFQEIIIEDNINEWIYDEAKQLLYTSIPQFILCASKNEK